MTNAGPKKPSLRYRKKQEFESIRVWVPKSIAQILAAQSLATRIPKSRLIAYAVDNELDSPVPFNYPCPPPTTAYIEGAYMEEAQKITRYLSNFEHGMSRDMLMLARRDIGVENRQTFLLALRELFERRIIEEVRPPKSTKFKHHQDYRVIQFIEKDLSKTNYRRKKILQQKAELEAKLKELEEQDNAPERRRKEFQEEELPDVE